MKDYWSKADQQSVRWKESKQSMLLLNILFAFMSKFLYITLKTDTILRSYDNQSFSVKKLVWW